MIGPGRLVLVVGPSGAGKDTLIAGAKASLAGNPSVVFPRRVVTRSSSPAEDHDTLDPAAFDAAAARGDFGLWWEAHGLKYGIPQAIDGDLAAGRTAVCNVSRMIIADARARYARISVVLVTAPADVLAARLSARARASDGSVDKRLDRRNLLPDIASDVTIETVGSAETSIRAFVAAITG